MAAFPNVWSESVHSFHVLRLHKCTRFVSYFPAQCFHAPSCVIEGASERFHALVFFFFYCSRLKDSFFDIICLRRDTLSPAAAGFLASFENKHLRFDDEANHLSPWRDRRKLEFLSVSRCVVWFLLRHGVVPGFIP